jgi:histidinol dehydrogenase
VDDFIKKSSLLHVTKDGYEKLRNAGECLAEREGFTAHRDSIRIRKTSKK